MFIDSCFHVSPLCDISLRWSVRDKAVSGRLPVYAKSLKKIKKVPGSGWKINSALGSHILCMMSGEGGGGWGWDGKKKFYKHPFKPFKISHETTAPGFPCSILIVASFPCDVLLVLLVSVQGSLGFCGLQILYDPMYSKAVAEDKEMN